MAKAFIYVISGDHGRQKIGITDNPAQRIKDLQTGSPFPLKFEFVGETIDNVAGPIEVEAHFMLNQYKSPGGDEWFTVPPDVAITAVMAAAHRLGYRVKPVDADAIAPKYPPMIGGRPPAWVWVLLSPAIAFFGYTFFFSLVPLFQAGAITHTQLALGALVYSFAIWILRVVVTLLGVWSGIGPRLAIAIRPSAIWAALRAPWTEEQRYY
ncbi:GIY-YIG nuclease family protein [Bradyrhizobium lablabi]|uniref:GIY-YIG nuclease family protein n=1 Tax=Bradyrhizobium lablabi TaxID=722472 RepID=UPI001BA7EFEE|nr:GIY-YIG nuclease family protein [Bradyrhizobium lablabi]MBR0693678.1 GIY-YIG nuclease family protein [Bradyrhizobium lablabi]